MYLLNVVSVWHHLRSRVQTLLAICGFLSCLLPDYNRRTLHTCTWSAASTANLHMCGLLVKQKISLLPWNSGSLLVQDGLKTQVLYVGPAT